VQGRYLLFFSESFGNVFQPWWSSAVALGRARFLFLLASFACVALGLGGCSSNSGEAGSEHCGSGAACATSTSTITTTTTTLPPTTTTVPPEYPKEVPMAAIDPRFAASLGQDQGKATAVLLTPGVYAERGAGALGTLDDYAGYVGACADVKQYAALHPGGYSCW
jgi:hypothetical protein